MKDFSVWQHHHHGWTMSKHEACSEEDALKSSVYLSHPWLSTFEHSIVIKDDRYVVTYMGEPRTLGFGSTQTRGDYWFSDDIRIGKDDDCPGCGGTEVNHYNPFIPCWKCGRGGK